MSTEIAFQALTKNFSDTTERTYTGSGNGTFQTHSWWWSRYQEGCIWMYVHAPGDMPGSHRHLCILGTCGRRSAWPLRYKDADLSYAYKASPSLSPGCLTEVRKCTECDCFLTLYNGGRYMEIFFLTYVILYSMLILSLFVHQTWTISRTTTHNSNNKGQSQFSETRVRKAGWAKAIGHESCGRPSHNPRCRQEPTVVRFRCSHQVHTRIAVIIWINSARCMPYTRCHDGFKLNKTNVCIRGCSWWIKISISF